MVFDVVLFKKMPRKGKSVYRNYAENDLETAVSAVKAGIMSQRAASRHYDVPQATLSNRLTGLTESGARSGRPTALPEKVETELVKRCQEAAQCGFGMSRQQLLIRAGRLCRAMHIITPFRNGVPGKDWFRGLKGRHPDRVLKSPAPLSEVRCKALNATTVGKYMVELGQVMTSLDLHHRPDRVWNMDETGSRLEHKPAKVCARKGASVVGRTGNSKDSVSVLVCVNAAGTRMQPMVIVKGTSHRALQAYNTSSFDAIYTYQKKAWIKDLLGEEWFEKVFLRQCGAARPQLLILDNHHSHEVTGLLERAKQEDIHIMAIPPHTTSKLCPLDVACFSSLKCAYSRIVSEWMTESPLNHMNKWEWPSLFNKASDQAMNAGNIMSGFRATGICPFNPRAISADDLSTSGMLANPTVPGLVKEHPLEWVYRELVG